MVLECGMRRSKALPMIGVGRMMISSWFIDPDLMNVRRDSYPFPSLTIALDLSLVYDSSVIDVGATN